MRLSRGIGLVLLLSAIYAYGGTNDTALTSPQGARPLTTVPVNGTGDSVSHADMAEPDRAAVSGTAGKGDTAAEDRRAPAPSPQSGVAPVSPQPGSLKLVKRDYNRRQVVLATGMMIFVAAIMTAAQQWNPR